MGKIIKTIFSGYILFMALQLFLTMDSPGIACRLPFHDRFLITFIKFIEPDSANAGTEYLGNDAVKNMIFSELPENKIKICYDLLSKYPMNIKLIGKADNYKLDPITVTGDAGLVIPGKGRCLIWDVLTDYPDGLDKFDIALDLEASQNPAYSGANDEKDDKNNVNVGQSKTTSSSESTAPLAGNNKGKELVEMRKCVDGMIKNPRKIGALGRKIDSLRKKCAYTQKEVKTGKKIKRTEKITHWENYGNTRVPKHEYMEVEVEEEVQMGVSGCSDNERNRLNKLEEEFEEEAMLRCKDIVYGKKNDETEDIIYEEDASSDDDVGSDDSE